METPKQSLDRLRLEVEELRASRKRLALAHDADRRRLERDLHDGPQQHLVALAVNLQLARQLVDSDPEAANALLDEMGTDVQRALVETARLADRIYPPLLETGGVAAAVRAAAAGLGVRVHVEVTARKRYPPEVVGAMYFCCLEALERAGEDASATVTVRDVKGMLAFDIVADDRGAGTAVDALGRSRDRVEAMAGRLTIEPQPGGRFRMSGRVPLSR